MAVVFDRVKESSASTGTGDFALGGAETGGFRAFSEVFSVGDQTYYTIVADSGEYEVGIGDYSAADTLSRTTVLSSSNSNNLVDFLAGDKTVFVTMPAAKSVTIDQSIAFAIALG